MGIKSYNPYTPSRRHMTGSDFSEITKSTPEKSLTVSLKKNAGRNNQGKITVRHRGGGDVYKRQAGTDRKIRQNENVKRNIINHNKDVYKRQVYRLQE